jgi:hypothetical protein
MRASNGLWHLSTPFGEGYVLRLHLVCLGITCSAARAHMLQTLAGRWEFALSSSLGAKYRKPSAKELSCGRYP